MANHEPLSALWRRPATSAAGRRRSYQGHGDCQLQRMPAPRGHRADGKTRQSTADSQRRKRGMFAMIDNNRVLIFTSTMPDGSFDIFHFTAMVQAAPLALLYLEHGNMEALIVEYESLCKCESGDALEELTLKLKLYEGLQDIIATEIYCIEYPMPRDLN
jgi:hypothetical protein